MKKTMMMSLLALTVLCLQPSLNLMGAPGGTTSDSDSRVIEIAFSDTTSYSITGSGSFFTPVSIAITFKAGAQVNTLDINLVRDGVTRDMLDYTYTGRTLIWYLPNSFFLKAGDVITIDNTSTASAVATLNLQF